MLSNGRITGVVCFMYLVKSNLFCYLFGCILKSEVFFNHKYIRVVLWEATFKVVCHTTYSFYQYCFRVRILGIVLIREVLLGTRICSSNSASLFTR